MQKNDNENELSNGKTESKKSVKSGSKVPFKSDISNEKNEIESSTSKQNLSNEKQRKTDDKNKKIEPAMNNTFSNKSILIILF